MARLLNNECQQWYLDTGLDMQRLAVNIETSECGITSDKFTEILQWLAEMSNFTEIAVVKNIQDPLVAMLNAISAQVLEKSNSS